jgi:iron(III) transport system ATP-binding protein
VLAARPDEIVFADKGVAGVVARKAYLGEVIDYRVRVGEAEVRVQTSRRRPGPMAGEACRLDFVRPRWYPFQDATAD